MITNQQLSDLFSKGVTDGKSEQYIRELAGELLERRLPAANIDLSNPKNRHVTMDSRSIHFPDMKREDVDPHAIPHCLSMICRYNGFVREFYSVAEHSVIVAQMMQKHCMN